MSSIRIGLAAGNGRFALALSGFVMAALATAAATDASWADGPIRLNEIRVDQPGSDLDEYFEVAGPSMASLEGVTFLVIGDGAGGSGVIEEIVSLDGYSLDFNGILLVCESTFTLAPGGVVTGINFENSDNLSHLLVTGFTGALNDDLDLDDDGMLDVAPWTAILDAVATVENLDTPPTGTEWWYGEPVGPAAPGVPPSHILRCSDTGGWVIGAEDPAAGLDTPNAPNPPCSGLSGCGGDLDLDGEVDADDLSAVLALFGTNDPMADLDLSGTVDGGDLGWLLAVWGPCE